MTRRLRTAERYTAFSVRLAQRAAALARRAGRSQGFGAAASVIVLHQAAQANESSAAMTAMLLEQDLRAPEQYPIQPLAFTTPVETVEQMLATIEREIQAEAANLEREIYDSFRFDQLAESLVQEAGRSAQQVSVTTREDIYHVRHLTLPSCSRCVVLAGRVYRYSQGFERHPGCDCTMVPTTVANRDLVYDPEQLARDGQVAGLSKADLRAIGDGAESRSTRHRPRAPRDAWERTRDRALPTPPRRHPRRAPGRA